MPKVTQEAEVSVANPPPHSLRALQSAALRAGARASPRRPSVSCLSGCYAGVAVHLSPASGAAQGQTRRSQRPDRAPRPQPPDGSACVRARPSRRGQRRSGQWTISRALDLCAPGQLSPGHPPSKMKKLQGAHLRKVGHEGGGLGAHLEEGWRDPPPSRPLGKV